MSAILTGEVRNGVIVLEPAVRWPEGTKVRVEAIEQSDVLIPKPDVDPIAGTRELLLTWARKAEEIVPPMRTEFAEKHDGNVA